MYFDGYDLHMLPESNDEPGDETADIARMLLV
jgi:hypothetical protein